MDQVVCLLGVSRSHRSALELGKTTVERVLSSLETGSGRSSGAGLLSTHSESAGGSLSGRDTTSLAGLGLSGSRSRAEVIEGEFEVFDIVDGGLVGLTALPVVELHGESTGGSWDRRKGSRFRGERGESICSVLCVLGFRRVTKYQSASVDKIEYDSRNEKSFCVRKETEK